VPALVLAEGGPRGLLLLGVEAGVGDAINGGLDAGRTLERAEHAQPGRERERARRHGLLRGSRTPGARVGA
jgi:hypothetical protein